MALEVVSPPGTGVWRVARAPDPLAFSDPFSPEELDEPNTAREAVMRDNASLKRIASLYGITVF